MDQPLKRNTLGRTGLEVTSLGFGAMEIRGGPRGREVSDEDAGIILNAVLDSGINFIDTSIDYGRSEELIGEHISQRRSEFYLASKCGCAATPEAAGEHIFTRANIVAGVEQSLKRMRTDHLDIVQFHSSPSKAILDNEDAIQTLLDLKEQGKIRFLGSSSTLPNLADHVEMGVFDEFQIPYSGLSREHENWITRAANAGIGTVIRGGVAKGQPDEVNDTWAKWDEADLDPLLEVGESRTAFMLRFTLTHPGLHTTIVGTLNPVHLRENVSAAGRGTLSPDTYAEPKRRLDAAGVTAEPA
jgi:aryl-alcohol dehydrogenase-like predicted oxidoreductase